MSRRLSIQLASACSARTAASSSSPDVTTAWSASRPPGDVTLESELAATQDWARATNSQRLSHCPMPMAVRSTAIQYTAMMASAAAVLRPMAAHRHTDRGGGGGEQRAAKREGDQRKIPAPGQGLAAAMGKHGGQEHKVEQHQGDERRAGRDCGARGRAGSQYPRPPALQVSSVVRARLDVVGAKKRRAQDEPGKGEQDRGTAKARGQGGERLERVPAPTLDEDGDAGDGDGDDDDGAQSTREGAPQDPVQVGSEQLSHRAPR